MNKTYKLRTFKDVMDNVPPEKIALCMNEIRDGMIQATTMIAEFKKNFGALADEVKIPWPDEVRWTDDDKGEITVTAHFDEKHRVSVTTKAES